MTPEYKTVPILDAARRAGVRIADGQAGRYEVKAFCPFCLGRTKNPHLYLNTEKNRFFCSGAENTETAYRCMPKFAGFPIKKHLKNWKRAISRCSRRQHPRSQGRNIWPRWNSGTMSTTTCWRCCHCQSMTFWTCSAAALRWTPSSRICTAPCRLGGTRSELAQTLSRTHDLHGVPGFYRSENGDWRLSGNSGLLIPYCTAKGYIQGLQRRAEIGGKRCYVWVSSNPDKAGKTAVRSYHVERERMGGSISRAMSTAQPLPSQRGRSRAIPRAVCPMERFTYAHLGSMQSSTFPRPSVHFLWSAF